MLKKFIHSRLSAFERTHRYDASYLRAVLDADLSAFMRLSKLNGISTYVRDVPQEVSWCVKLVGAMHEDCGPCSQLMVTMAEQAGVAPETLRAVASGETAALDPNVQLGVHYARAVLVRDPTADTLRDEVVARWGKRGLVSLAFGLVAARTFPTLKYALGYGRTCSRLEVGGKPVAVTTSPQAGLRTGFAT